MPKVMRFPGRATLIAGLLAGASIAAPVQGQQAPPQTAKASRAPGIAAWDIASPNLVADPDVRFGRLANGMRYAVRRGKVPEGAVAIRFTVDAGGREESDAEIGAAHFLEHMAFNGSTNIPEGQLLPRLERLGLAFGSDTNAETGFEHTTYMLDVPSADEKKLSAALEILREVASELKLAPDAIERERGILRNEYQLHDSSRRRMADLLTAALPGGRLGERLGGQAANLDAIGADMLRSFYDGYYRPEKATLILVGDYDPAAMETLVQRHFESWRGRGTARQSFVPAVTPRRPPAIGMFVDPAIPEAIELQSLAPYAPPANARTAERDTLLRAIGSLALSNRLVALSRSADSPMLGGQAMMQDMYRSFDVAAVALIAKDGKWRETAMLAEQQLRRAFLHGFTAAEIDEAKTNIEAALANAVAQAAARPSSALAAALTQASLADAVAMSADGRLQLYRAMAQEITPETVSAAFRQRWQSGPDLVHVSTKAPIEGGALAIGQALTQSSQIAVAPPQAAKSTKFAYDDFGPAGKVLSDKRIDDLGIRAITFANGTRLNLKKTDFEPARIAFQMDVGAGAMAFPSDKPGLAALTQVVLSIDGLKAHGPDELRQLLAGRQVSLAMAAGQDALTASGVTTPDDLALQLELLAARLTATAYRPETQAQWQAAAPVLAKNLGGSAQQLLGVALAYLVAGGDARLGLGDPQAFTARAVDELRAAIEPQLHDGSVDVALVGDFDEETAIAAFARTLGALPARDAAKATTYPAPRFGSARKPQILIHQGPANQAMLALSWPTDDGSNLGEMLTRTVLAQIFQIRLTETLREELGMSYTPQAIADGAPKDNDFGHLTVFSSVDPLRLAEASKVMRAVAGRLAAEPVSDDLLQRARQPMIEQMRESLRRNAGWTGIVARAQRDPEVLDRRRHRDALLAAITPQDIQAQARHYLTAEPLEIRVVAAEGAK